jgi:hypothetical protein
VQYASDSVIGSFLLRGGPKYCTVGQTTYFRARENPVFLRTLNTPLHPSVLSHLSIARTN